MMLVTHVYLIITGKSTVESFQGQDQSERETALLQREYGYFWNNQEKRKVRLHWKTEWGDTPVDARWRWGSPRQMWEQEMGIARLGWFRRSICMLALTSVPVGRPLGNGLTFPSNPRFGPNGEWLRKVDWPQGVV
jgi:palmitoyltransferase